MIKTKDIFMETREMFDNPLDHGINPITGFATGEPNVWYISSREKPQERPNKVENYLNR